MPMKHLNVVVKFLSFHPITEQQLITVCIKKSKGLYNELYCYVKTLPLVVNRFITESADENSHSVIKIDIPNSNLKQ